MSILNASSGVFIPSGGRPEKVKTRNIRDLNGVEIIHSGVIGTTSDVQLVVKTAEPLSIAKFETVFAITPFDGMASQYCLVMLEEDWFGKRVVDFRNNIRQRYFDIFLADITSGKAMGSAVQSAFAMSELYNIVGHSRELHPVSISSELIGAISPKAWLLIEDTYDVASVFHPLDLLAFKKFKTSENFALLKCLLSYGSEIRKQDLQWLEVAKRSEFLEMRKILQEFENLTMHAMAGMAIALLEFMHSGSSNHGIQMLVGADYISRAACVRNFCRYLGDDMGSIDFYASKMLVDLYPCYSFNYKQCLLDLNSCICMDEQSYRLQNAGFYGSKC